MHSAIAHAAVHIPAGRQTVSDAEDRFRADNPGISLTRGVLHHMYGLLERTVADAADQPSDLATRAAKTVLEQHGTAPADVDLLIYTGILADMEEPATAHVVAEKLGLSAPVFDLKNACNGVLNGIEVADAFIRAGQYRRVLVVSAEVSTRETRRTLEDPQDLLVALPSLSTGDMGSAVLVEARERPGILGSRFFANSWGWEAATLPNPYANNRVMGHLRIDSAKLAASFDGMPGRIEQAMTEIGVKPGDLDFACVHQPSVAFTRLACEWAGVTADQIIPTFAAHGNVATNTIPLQLAMALETGRLKSGDLVGLFGYASGASVGVMVCEW